jgi:hypothetical protein
MLLSIFLIRYCICLPEEMTWMDDIFGMITMKIIILIVIIRNNNYIKKDLLMIQ